MARRLIEAGRKGKRPGHRINNAGATLGNWNDRRSDHDRRAEATLTYRAIDRIAGWLYTWRDGGVS
jgi:hypothetical protein